MTKKEKLKYGKLRTIWIKEYNFPKGKEGKTSTFQITKYFNVKDKLYYYWLSTSPKRTCGTVHASLEAAKRFALL